MSLNDLIHGKASYQPNEKDEIVYLQAEKEWDEREGTKVKRIHNQNLMIFFLIISNLLQTSGLIYQSSKSLLAPYVIHEKENGQVVFAGMIDQKSYTPSESVQQYFIKEFVENSRTLPEGAKEANRIWEKAYYSTTGAAKQRLRDEFEKDRMKERQGTEYSQVDIKSVVQQGSTDTYQIRWTESVFDREGKLKDKYDMTGSFTIELNPPKEMKDALTNPLGLYIKMFSWTRER